MAERKGGPSPPAAADSGAVTKQQDSTTDSDKTQPPKQRRSRPRYKPPPPKVPSPAVLKDAMETYKKWLTLPDDRVIDFVCGVYFANRLAGDPVWGGLVGPAGDAKTELLRSLGGDDILQLGNLTPKTLISGLPADMNQGREPSLLSQLDAMLLVIKDLTPVLSGSRETRTEILGQFRDAYDGYSTKAFGTGEVKRFHAHFGLLFGVTPVIESCWPVINQLGERFIYYRCAEGDSLDKVKAALANSDQKTEMRDELAAAAARVLDQPVPDHVEVPESLVTHIMHLADFVAKARTPVKRAARTEEIEYAPVAEVGTRLAGQFIQLARGIAIARGQSACDDSIMAILRHVAASGIARTRLALLQRLSRKSSPEATQALSQGVQLPTGTVRRALEDLWALGLVERTGRPGIHWRWALSALARERLAQTQLFSVGQA